VMGVRELAQRVYALTGVLTIAVASVAGLVWGRADLLGALVGGTVMLLNFAGLYWVAARLGVSLGQRPSGGAQRALVVSVSGARLVLVALTLAGALALGGVGPRGLIVALLVVPWAVVVVGLLGARTADGV